ncbi:SCP2 sterol-binding domain-containing protein [Gammaproteobacteria bacterium AB-CW1]|uniref:Ubiquinone biosynthesis accessory factor UbiT n=1 Tax=Natronospira elongata TaxID=3110268 RepID=A0AAP6JDE0_9GAMM|nr:SCP2 sterol-binding domain-containing protein [Gammaproteobacteria bacterium AB-CW1]
MRCQALLVEPLLQQVFADRIEDGDLDFLSREVVEIAITDIGLHWFLTLEDGRLRLIPRGRPAVTVAGGLPEFLLLASRREDPDTLFFERRITVEGDTELGLLVKNLLDSIELTALPPLLRRAVEAGASWA